VNEKTIHKALENSLMVVTNLSPIIGYEKAGEIAQRAFKTGKTIKEIVKEMKLDIENIDALLDPKNMT
jgi:fumarate hydratase class II